VERFFRGFGGILTPYYVVKGGNRRGAALLHAAEVRRACRRRAVRHS
jgi:hypothetical protein